ncbi:hypothetical protein XH87_07785 [Bradyrhizobium sp. CCBAU 53415]|nr:hypothetical protein [Bradyrhizobium sp. CCBAU 53415]
MIFLLLIPSAFPALEIWPSLIFIVALALFAPAYGLALGIFIAPFQQFASLNLDQFHLLQGVAWSFIAFRLLLLIQPRDLLRIRTSPTIIFFGAFTCLVLFRNAIPFTSRFYFLDAGFVVTIFLITMTVGTATRLPSYSWTLVSTAMLSAVLFSILFDFALVYIPLAELTPYQSALPPDKLRLAGLHANPNATSKFLLAAVSLTSALVVGRVFKEDRLRAWYAWLLLAVLLLALSATAAKSGIAALVVSLSIAACLLMGSAWTQRHSSVLSPNDQVMEVGKVFALFVFAVASWTIVIAPPIKERGAAAWLASGLPLDRPDLKELAGNRAGASEASATHPVTGGDSRPEGSRSSLTGAFIEEFRIGKSFQLKAGVAPGSSLESPLKSELQGQKATKRDCGIMCTGQRDLLWSAGLSILKQNWFWGLGYGGWKQALDQKLGYPFDSPHVGFLELAGEFGIMGAVLYLSFVAFIFNRAWRGLCLNGDGYRKAFIVGGSLFSVAILTTELFEPAKFFAMAPHAIWIWTFLAMQERMLDDPDWVSSVG